MGNVSFWALAWAFVKALPELLKLVNYFCVEQKKAKLEGKIERTVKNDLSNLHQAFTNNDSTEFNKLFNARSDKP